MSEHHRITPEGKELGKLTRLLYQRGRKLLEADGLTDMNLPTIRDEMCPSCACQEGSVPNGCSQTQLDLIKAVVEGRGFLCHAPMDGKLCAGYVAARAAHVESPLQPMIMIANSWDYSPPDEPAGDPA